MGKSTRWLRIVSQLPVFLMVIGLAVAWAGPPFLTDDPEPVEYRHGELNVGGLYAYNRGGGEGFAPFVEFNYGAIPDLQLHMIAPMAFSHDDRGPTLYGPGDLELGAKYRFIHETEIIPQVATFVLTELPTGDRDRGLGTGHVRLFLPIWVQKGFGPWTVYGGGGFWINPGTENRNYWQMGGVVQREITKYLTLGVELYGLTAQEDAWVFMLRRVVHGGHMRTVANYADLGQGRTGFNGGAIINLTDDYHILLSAGRDLSGENRFSTYAAFQWTFGK